MPSRKYPLEINGPKRLKIAWPSILSYKNLTVNLDGKVVATIANSSELDSGAEVTLPNGSNLQIQTVRSPYSPNSKDLHLLLNGQPLLTAANDPAAILRETYGLMFLIGGFGAGAGAIMLLISLAAQPFVRTIGVSVFAYGLAFLVLGFFVRRRSLPALVLAIGLVVLSSLLLLVTSPNTLIISAVLLFIAYGLSRGIKPLQKLKQQQ